MNFALALSFLQNLVVVLFILICCTIVLVVLLQKGRGGGIGAAFGGGAAGSLLGTKTGDFLTWVTICLVAAFLVMAILMGKFMRPKVSPDLGTPAGAPSSQSPTATEDAGGALPTSPETGEAETAPAIPDTAVPEEPQEAPAGTPEDAAGTTEEPTN